MSHVAAPSAVEYEASKRLLPVWFWPWFWRTFLVVSLAYAWYSFYVPSNEITWAKDYSSAKQSASRTGGPMVLFFTGEWCVPCRIMKRVVWADEEVETIVNEAFIPVMIYVGTPEATDALGQYRIGPTPTTIVTDANGNELRRREGGIGKSEFLELLAGPTG